jgi:hypothetical protein
MEPARFKPSPAFFIRKSIVYSTIGVEGVGFYAGEATARALHFVFFRINQL